MEKKPWKSETRWKMLEFVGICTYNNELWVKTYKYKTMKGVHTMNEQNHCLEKQPLCDEMLQKMDAYWRATN